MSRVTRRSGGHLDDIDVFSDLDNDFDFLGDMDASRHRAKGRVSAKHRAAWQRIDERRELEQLRAELADWEEWDLSLADEPVESADAR